MSLESKGPSMAKDLRLQRAFDGKRKHSLKAKALQWQRQGHFEGKSLSVAKALRWQMPFDGSKDASMVKAKARAL
jgi:hypothetical protein